MEREDPGLTMFTLWGVSNWNLSLCQWRWEKMFFRASDCLSSMRKDGVSKCYTNALCHILYRPVGPSCRGQFLELTELVLSGLSLCFEWGWIFFTLVLRPEKGGSWNVRFAKCRNHEICKSWECIALHSIVRNNYNSSKIKRAGELNSWTP